MLGDYAVLRDVPTIVDTGSSLMLIRTNDQRLISIANMTAGHKIGGSFIHCDLWPLVPTLYIRPFTSRKPDVRRNSRVSLDEMAVLKIMVNTPGTISDCESKAQRFDANAHDMRCDARLIYR